MHTHTHSDDVPCNLAKHIDWRLRAILPIVGLGKSERRHKSLVFNWLLFLFQDLKENMKVHMYTVTGTNNDCRNTKPAKAFSFYWLWISCSVCCFKTGLTYSSS